MDEGCHLQGEEVASKCSGIVAQPRCSVSREKVLPGRRCLGPRQVWMGPKTEYILPLILYYFTYNKNPVPLLVFDTPIFELHPMSIHYVQPR